MSLVSLLRTSYAVIIILWSGEVSGLLSLYLQMPDSEEEQSRFASLYLLYRDLMFRAAMRLLHNEPDAEDAVHQAFLSVLRHFSKIRQIDCPETKAYVVIITERKAIDMLRAQKRFGDEDPEELENAAVPPPGDGGLADAMAGLPRRYREALLLRYRHGYGTAELAALWGLKQASVQKLLWRAKQLLKERMEEDQDE